MYAFDSQINRKHFNIFYNNIRVCNFPYFTMQGLDLIKSVDGRGIPIYYR